MFKRGLLNNFNSYFFFEFSCNSKLNAFSRLDFATRKLPKPAFVLIIRTLCNKDL